MQSEKEAIISSEEDEGLFGSPPPSPGRGRSPSPGLALPSSSSGVSLVSQNVGTIALPGSQDNAELAVNPLALPFSESRHGLPRPPVNVFRLNENAWVSSSSSRSSPISSVDTVSRASSQTPSITKSRKRKSTTSGNPSRLPPLEIPLPDPSQPPPSNWLRSQAALLGHAGLVGGIKPASFSHGRPRGSTPSNPIVVDDANDMKNAQKPKSPRWQHHLATADLKLTPPPTRDIVDILIRQKEVFPILQDLLKLFSGNPGLASTYRDKQDGVDPPTKRRKLNCVPAGAADWDVPYPFQVGEGPQRYHDGWVENRAKQLVSQLVALIKTASRKAALRNLIQEQNQARERPEGKCCQPEPPDSEHLEPKTYGHGHYKPVTSFYGLDKSNVPEAPTDTPSISPPRTARSPSPPTTSSIEDLISSLVTTTPIGQSSNETVNDVNAIFSHVPQHTNDIDGVTDNWMALFQLISPEQNQNFLFSTAQNQGDGVSSVATDIPMDFGSWTFPDSSGEITSSMSTFSSSFLDSSQLMDVDRDIALPEVSSSPILDVDALFGHPLTATPSHLDPLSISLPQIPAGSGTPSLAASPIPSSLGGDFPMTPISGVGNDPNTTGNLEFGFDIADGIVPPSQSGMTDDVMNAASSLMALGGNLNGPWNWTGNLEGGSSSVEGNGIGADATPNNSKQAAFENRNAAVNARMDINQGQGQGDNNVPSSSSPAAGNSNGPKEQERGKEVEAEAVRDILPALMSAVLPLGIPLHTPNVNVGTSSVFTPPNQGATSSQPSNKRLDRAELVRLAKDRRAKLAEEIIKARTQLWETTIEHGVLMHLSKFYM
ncbi:hypothetical protein E1B28_011243 [Marasmius oreades]|uniref:Uncharacterized protein n=1 Tax=Marasmius oreades TaxID=181124 RepID=A0A9P7RUE5_9AGAR|nr:uncharacterized protein E1B28_011243 [Marasmius oreades]KAG7089575.1 hypothetical protein E1B28_011243 [Marasmius oreades]